MDPSSNPSLHLFLETIVGFDSVDDESRPGKADNVNISLTVIGVASLSPYYLRATVE